MLLKVVWYENGYNKRELDFSYSRSKIIKGVIALAINLTNMAVLYPG